jgi:uncharacterized integral membrane protein
MTHEFESRETDVGGLSGRQRLSLVAGALLVASLVLFIVQNTESTEIQFLTFDGEMPRWLLILVSAAVGSLLTMIVLFFVRRNRD